MERASGRHVVLRVRSCLATTISYSKRQACVCESCAFGHRNPAKTLELVREILERRERHARMDPNQPDGLFVVNPASMTLVGGGRPAPCSTRVSPNWTSLPRRLP
jgi:hypothetical protein